jgi:hypothetical protein
MILKILFFLTFTFSSYAGNLNKDFCIGYLEEVYWALDPIEVEEKRENIVQFFNENYAGASLLNFDLYYDPSQRQFVNSPSDNLIKVNYPNFEIMILDAYINLFTDSDQNYCPAFWDDCSEESLKSFFHGASDFSNQWVGEDRVIEYLDTDFKNHQCTQYLNTSINETEFIPNLNILIKELTK